MRATSVVVTEAIEDARGQIHIWGRVDGWEVAFLLARGALRDRKLQYGLAHIEVTVDDLADPTERTEDVIDDVPDADLVALRMIFAEHFDRWEADGVDAKTVKAEDGTLMPRNAPKSPTKLSRNVKRLTSLVQVVSQVPSRTPARVQEKKIVKVKGGGQR